MYSTIIFDLGGVLVDWNPRYLYRKMFDLESEMEYFLNHICTSDWNEQQDAGRSLEDATSALVAQHPEQAELIRAYYGRWEEMLGGQIQGTVDILEELVQNDRHRIYALTNWSAETFPIARERYPWLGLFEGIVVSGVEKMIKPDPKIYHTLLHRYEVEPEQALFIDDNPANVAGAKAVGLASIQFTSPDSLRVFLEEKGAL